MRISEIYTSIQGESTFAGLPCTFIRTTGCNLRCTWCDTTHSYYGGTEMSLQEILDAVLARPCRLVEITGGEPLLQEECAQLCQLLMDAGCQVLIETSGSQDLSVIPQGVIRIIDVKCPGSAMTHMNRSENLSLLRPGDELKFVIKDENDFHWAYKFIRQHSLEERATILFSPVFGEMDLKLLADLVLRSGLQARMQLQMHKIIWDAQSTGV